MALGVMIIATFGYAAYRFGLGGGSERNFDGSFKHQQNRFNENEEVSDVILRIIKGTGVILLILFVLYFYIVYESGPPHDPHQFMLQLAVFLFFVIAVPYIAGGIESYNAAKERSKTQK